MTTSLLRILKKPVLSINARSCYFCPRISMVERLPPHEFSCSPQRKIKQSWSYSFSTSNRFYSSKLSSHEFGEVCEETLDSLADYFEELVESVPALKNGDILYSDGVITANLGNDLGTYVINRQTPNQQIWLSSPTSGPKRYDFIDDAWVYKHDNSTLHSLLDRELIAALNCPIDFSSNCLFGKKNK